MKGLSPLIASIILIAFAVAIGGLISIWLTGFATKTTEYTSEQGDKSLQCSGARLQVDRVTDTEIVYSNPTAKTITGVTVYDEVGRNLTFNATDLLPGQVTNATWSRAGNTSVLLRGTCQGSVIVEGSCEAGRVCWK